MNDLIATVLALVGIFGFAWLSGYWTGRILAKREKR